MWKHYGDVTAVQNLNLACAEGEMLALLGPSGCGKSSTVKMAAGIEDVSAGEIFFGDRPVSRLAPAARNIAMVFEDYALYPHMTVRENISFPLAIRHLPSAQGSRRQGARSACAAPVRRPGPLPSRCDRTFVGLGNAPPKSLDFSAINRVRHFDLDQN